MKKQFTPPLNYFNLSFLLFIFFIINSCKKDNLSAFVSYDKTLIEDAKTAFEQQIRTKPNYTLDAQNNINTNFRKTLGKNPDWDNAKIKKTTLGNAVWVPISFDKKIFFKVDENAKPLALKDITYLIIYTNKNKNKIVEWVTFIPDFGTYNINDNKKFVGKMIIEDWYGNFKKGFYYNNSGVVFKLKTNNETNPSNLKVDANEIKTNRTYCASVPWYQEVFAFGSSYYSIGGYDLQCYIVESDPFNTDNTPTNEDAGGDTSPTDYYSYTAYNNVDTDSLSTDAKCIYDRLMQNNYFISLITQFQNNANLNLTFKMGSPVGNNGNPVAGQTQHDYLTTNFLITINTNLFQNVGGVEAANTFLHEAFHANLWLQAQMWYPNSLPSNFQNMSLLDQIKYIDDQAALSGNPSFVSTPQHQYISQQLQLIANSLKDYTRINYPDVYSDPRVKDASYIAMAFRGLEDTKIYNDHINDITQLNNDQMYAILAALTNTKCPKK